MARIEPKYALHHIGRRVVKRSGKPFKSGEKVATVKSVTGNPHSGKLAFTFEEDDSCVDVYQCVVYDNLREIKVCDCDCHIEGRVVMHFMDCCNLTYEEYIVGGRIDIEKWSKAFESIMGAKPTWRHDGKDLFYLIK